MWNCKACKQQHSDMRERCPTFGTPKPIKAIYKKEKRYPDEICDKCNRGGKLEPCDFCYGLFHPNCLKGHINACEDHAIGADFRDWLASEDEY